MRTRLVVSSVLAVSGVVAACGSGSPNARQPEQDAPIETLTSIVQLGDSIASGEGTLYGYTWDAAAARWTGGNVDAKWPEPFPDCHTSDYAYGTIVATYFGAELNQFACTGSTFANGIIAPRTTDGTEYRPAQFGDWDARTDLNGDYDAAAPQLVMITLGADDLQFANIVEQCIENGYEYYWDLAELECVDHNPGSTIETDFVQFLPTLERNYATLIQWIKDRATANEAPEPKIIVTNYANPLPPDGAVCNDTNYLYEDQIKYLSSLVDQINGIIDETITGLDDPDVAVADISGAYTPQGASHIWCSDDPWAYGLSIYSVSSPSSFESLAPFHPTPDGQESLAEHVIPVVRQWFAPSSDETPGTSPTTEPSTAPTTTS